jgi:glutathione peroxidase
MMSKIKVNGDDALPLFQYLKKEAGVKSIPWNFGKFLVDGQGKVIKFYDAKLKPKKDVLEDICKLLGNLETYSSA